MRRIADPVSSPAAYVGYQPVVVLPDLFQEPALVEGVEEPETHSLVESGPRNYIAESQNFPWGLEARQYAGRMDQRFYDVARVIGCLQG